MTRPLAQTSDCILGHRDHSYECPGCAEACGAVTTPDQWKWYRTRTSSKRIKAALDAEVSRRAALAVQREDDEK